MNVKKSLLVMIVSLGVIAGLLVAGWHFFKKDLANPKGKVVKPL